MTADIVCNVNRIRRCHFTSTPHGVVKLLCIKGMFNQTVKLFKPRQSEICVKVNVTRYSLKMTA